MRPPFSWPSFLLILSGITLLSALLYDAGYLTTLLGLNPNGGEAIVVLAGFTLVIVGLIAGVEHLGQTVARANRSFFGRFTSR